MKKVYILLCIPHEITKDNLVEVQAFETRKAALKAKLKKISDFLDHHEDHGALDGFEPESLVQTALKGKKALKAKKYEEAEQHFDHFLVFSMSDPFKHLEIREEKVRK